MIKAIEASPVLDHFGNNLVTLEMDQTKVVLAVDRSFPSWFPPLSLL